jgi:hypothetical protein
MTKRNPISTEQNIWFDTEQVDNNDLSLEQNYNDTITSGIINNHIGSGILSESLEQNIVFDSLLTNTYLDGVAVSPQNQPTDNNLGNQLEIILTNSIAAYKKTVKVGIIGLDFESNLQFETFYFRANETQLSRKHFTKVLVLLFNDFIGDPDLSMNLGGRLIIKDAKPMTLSRDPIMVAQDVEPNLFFRDFFLDGPLTLQALLQSALPTYNIDTLNIFTSEKDNKVLLNGDVTTQIGQKFVATTNNIQKITLLLSVRNLDLNNEDDLVWNGDLVISIYPLQSDIDCPSDISPSLPIDFSPSNIPVAQISMNYATLLAAGTELDSVPQPVDFIFSNSPVAGGNVLIPSNYYALAVKRSGSANKCDILMAVGSDRVTNSRITSFTGDLWVDIPEEDLWFKVWTDAAKVSDGQAYDTGHGITVQKTTIDIESQATVDYCFNNIQFTGNDVYRAVVSASTSESVPVPDQSTGNPVLSRKQFIPQVELLNSIDIANLDEASEPLLIGSISDKNRKFYDSISSIINSTLYTATMAGDELLVRIIDDPTDSGRYNTNVTALVTSLLNGDFIGAKITPNANNPSIFYRVANAKLCSMILGDVNGDGIIDLEDLNLLNSYLGYDLNLGLPLHSVNTTDGYTTTFNNGYLTYITPFTNLFTVNFQLVDPNTDAIVAAGLDGVLVANPSDERLAQFTSASVDFGAIVGLSSYKLVIFAPGNDANQGGFDITSLDTVTDVITIRKVILTGDTISQMLRADIDGDFHITYTDGYLLQSYIDKVSSVTSPGTIYPAPSTDPYSKIGTRFNVVKFKLEKFVDRDDDYTNLSNGRSTGIHVPQDIFSSDGYFASHDFYTFPAPISFQKQLTWSDTLIVTNSRAKLVPTIFSTQTGFIKNSCDVRGTDCEIFPPLPDFDSGRVDFFVPNNLIVGEGGELKNPDGSFYKVDFEVGTIVLEIPDGMLGAEKTISVMDDFVINYTGDGITRLGFPAMKFADCSYVTSNALADNQIRLSVSVQSFSPNINGMNIDGYTGVIVDGKIGVSVDYATGFITLNFSNLFQDEILRTLSTKIQISVYLKKGGFNNIPLFVDSTKVQNLLNLISSFSGANDGGEAGLVNLETDVTGILPIEHGGTGLDAVGPTGYVWTSDGTGANWEPAGGGGGSSPKGAIRGAGGGDSTNVSGDNYVAVVSTLGTYSGSTSFTPNIGCQLVYDSGASAPVTVLATLCITFLGNSTNGPFSLYASIDHQGDTIGGTTSQWEQIVRTGSDNSERSITCQRLFIDLQPGDVITPCIRVPGGVYGGSVSTVNVTFSIS